MKMKMLLNRVFSRVYRDGEAIVFANETIECKLEHIQDCCEDVYIESIVGDLTDLENCPILKARESSKNDPDADESGCWTFYKLATRKGYVDVRFYGSSNGFYSESASLIEYTADGKPVW